MLKRGFVAAAVALAAVAVPAQAQVPRWDSPQFFSPRPMDDIGVYYFKTNRAGNRPDANGLKAIWRQSGNINLGVHAGIGDLDQAGNTILVGAEFYNQLGSVSMNTGLPISWSLGAGATFGDEYVDLSIPLGVSVGLNLGSGNVSVLPYVHPRVSFDLVAVGEGDDEETFTDFG